MMIKYGKLVSLITITLFIVTLICSCKPDDDDNNENPHEHNLTYVEKVEATCTENGNIDYWMCSTCGKKYADRNATTEITDIVIPAAHSEKTELKDYKDPTKYTDGYSGDKYCLKCGEMLVQGEVIKHTSVDPALIVSSAEINGNNMKVIISIINNPGIASLKFDILYSDILTIQSIDFSESFGIYTTSPAPYINPQTINFVSPNKDISIDGEFVIINFIIDENIDADAVVELSLLLDEKNIFNYNMQLIEFDAVNMTVQVHP